MSVGVPLLEEDLVTELADTGQLAPLATTTAVVEQYQRMVYAICLTHTRCRVDADDAFQEVFLTYHRRQPACHDEEHRKAWLITTTLQIARRLSNSSWRTRTVPLAADSDQFGQVEVHFPNADQDALFSALAGLPINYRTVIHLFYFEDLPVNQIAAILDIEPGAVKMRLSRGRVMLREALTKENCDA